MTTTIQMPKVGDIYVAQWGYDQTNVQFYQVVRATEKTVWVQEVMQTITETTSWGSENVVASIEPKQTHLGWNEDGQAIWEVAPITRHKIQSSAYGTYIKMNSYKYAYPWNGEKVMQTSWG